VGSIALPDGNTIALLEVVVEDQVRLARNRAALRDFVTRFIDEATATATVLAVFHQPANPLTQQTGLAAHLGLESGV
jgi:hypothetical protein